MGQRGGHCHCQQVAAKQQIALGDLTGMPGFAWQKECINWLHASRLPAKKKLTPEWATFVQIARCKLRRHTPLVCGITVSNTIM
ncbi:hypothetical protein [Duganella sp. Leaf61]|uniref:hypothetical protein n=1 Tax=Duganella sp. Leaf61 TaxID=1736227 RepID=UPI0012E1189E|nr:hypothetical protein [Duganella sp. Leaf61]